MSVLTSWLASQPPDAAVEISPEAVSVASLGTRGADPVVTAHGSEPLPAGAVVPALTGHNVVDRTAVAAALRAACDKADLRPRRVALVIPDLAARVSLVPFDNIPARRDDLDQLLHWQMRKSAPFPIEDAVLTYSPGARRGAGGEFIVALARRDVVREYEAVCEDQGMHAGLVDLSTLCVVNLFLSGAAAQGGDWLVVQMKPAYTSIAIMRGPDPIFFRSRAEGDEELLEDVVHQTAMYYQDRLAGAGFARVFLGGAGRSPGSLEAARRSLEGHLAARVEPIDPTRAAAVADRLGEKIAASPALTSTLAPLVGMLLRARREALGPASVRPAVTA
jgi:Tfp pilus assembly PilM family ATPase